jgi:hypothetical protein
VIRIRIKETGQVLEMMDQPAILRLNEGSAELAPLPEKRHFAVQLSKAFENTARWLGKAVR